MRLVVVGPAVVLPLDAGGEQYLYRSGAELPADGYTEAGLRHAVSVGLIRLVEPAGESPDAGRSTRAK